MTLEEFTKDLHQDILARSEDSPNYATDIFTDDVIDAMTEAGEADGHVLCNCRRRGYKVNAFNISEDGDCVDLFVTLFNNQDPPVRVSRTEVDRHFTWLQTFFLRCLSDSFRAGLEESSAEFDAAHSVHAQRDLITRGRLFFVTDGLTPAAEYEDAVTGGVRFNAPRLGHCAVLPDRDLRRGTREDRRTRGWATLLHAAGDQEDIRLIFANSSPAGGSMPSVWEANA